MPAPKKIYIAGPAVFNPDFGAAYYSHARALLEEKGVVALVPTDSEAKEAFTIRKKNVGMIEACDAIIADLSPFRSKEPDCGTAFEVGYAAALGKILITFSTDNRTMLERYGAGMAEGTKVEDFGLPFNLMLHDGTPVFDSFDAAFAHFVDKYLAA